jgi:hypothetical protein
VLPAGRARRAAYGRAVLPPHQEGIELRQPFGSKQKNESANVSRWPRLRAAMIVRWASSDQLRLTVKPEEFPQRTRRDRRERLKFKDLAGVEPVSGGSSFIYERQ